MRVHDTHSVIDLLDVKDDTHSWSVNDTLQLIGSAESGIVVLLHPAESGPQLLDRVTPVKTGPRPPARTDLRDYGIGAQILKDLNVGKMRLLAIPRKMPSMAGFGLEVAGYLEPEEKRQQEK